jgi:hypothetical protein
MTWVGHKGMSMEAAECRRAGVDIGWIFRSYTQSPQISLLDKYCKDPCGRALDMSVVRISAFDHKSEYKCALLQYPHQEGEDEA